MSVLAILHAVALAVAIVSVGALGCLYFIAYLLNQADERDANGNY